MKNQVQFAVSSAQHSNTCYGISASLFKQVCLLVFVLLAIAGQGWGQSLGDYRSKTSGNWNSIGSWERYDGANWQDAVATPTSADNAITIRSPHTITISAVGLTYDQVTVDSGAQVTVAAGITHTLSNGAGTDLIINGTWLNQGGTWTVASTAWTVGAGGTYIHNTTSSAATPLNQVTLDANSNFIYRGSSSLTPAFSTSGRTYGNLVIESTSGNYALSASGMNPLTVNGNFTLGAGVTITTTQTGVMTFAGNFTQNGTLTNSTGTQVYNFTGSGKTISGSGTIGFETVSINTGASITLGSNIQIASGFTCTVGGTLHCGTNIVSGAGAFTLDADATLSTANSSGVTGSIAVSGTMTYAASASYIFNGTTQNTGFPALPSIWPLKDLTISSTGITTLGSQINMSGNLSISTGSTLTPSNTIKIGGNWVNDGSFNAGSYIVEFTKSSGTQTVNNGASSFYILHHTGSGTLQLVTNNLTVPFGVYNFGGSLDLNTKTLNLSFEWFNNGNAAIGNGLVNFTYDANITGGSLTQFDHVSIQNAVTINALQSFYLSGNWTNNGSFVHNNNTVTLNGSSLQTIGGGGNNTFYHVTLNNANGAIITGTSLSVYGTLTLNTGNLSVGTQSLLFGQSASVTGNPGFSAANMIVADGGGFVAKFADFGYQATFTYPVGDNNGTPEYSPITLAFTSGTFTGGSSYVSLRNTHNTHDNSTTNYLNRYWTVNTSGYNSFSCNVLAHYVQADVIGIESKMKCGKWNGAWTKYTTPSDSVNNYFTANGVTSFSEFTMLDAAAVTIDEGATEEVCQDGVLMLHATASGAPALSYSWSGGLGTGATSTAVPSNTPSITTYTVTVTDGNGLTATASITVTVNEAPLCENGGTVNVNCGCDCPPGFTGFLCETALCSNPAIPTLSTSSATNCGTQSTTLSINTGTLNDATDWQWYSGSCGGISIGSGTSVIVSPAVTTTYYARGEGGCVAPGSCGSITITVNPIVSWYLDADNDGYYLSSQLACISPGVGWHVAPVIGSGDCNDGNALVYPGTTQVCYTGPPGTSGVGTCHAGTQTCLGNGTWSACSGMVTPVAEICNGLDDNCNGVVDEGFSILGEINLQGGSPLTTIADGDITPRVADSTDFGAVLVGATKMHSFTIQNTGTTNITISSIVSSNIKFAVSGAPTTIIPSGAATFNVAFSPTTAGLQTATITINNNDCDESLYDFLIQGTGDLNAFYVDSTATGNNDGTSWANAFTDFQSAVALALAADTVFVAKGTYKPSVGIGYARTRTFKLANGVLYFGGFPNGGGNFASRDFVANRSILSGDIGTANDSTDNCFTVVDASNLSTSTRMSGFTVERGNADSSNSSVMYGRSGAIYLHNTGAIRLDSVTVRNNFGKNGSAIFAGEPVNWNVTGCLFDRNTNASAIYIGGNASGTFNNCTFSNNQGFVGGAVSLNVLSATMNFTNCAFTGNIAIGSGGGGAVSGGAAASTFANCSFANNTATSGPGGALYKFYSTLNSFTNCTFTANTGGGGFGGGALCSSQGGFMVDRCVFNQNYTSGPSSAHGGAIYNNGGNTSVINSVFWGNYTTLGIGGAIYNNTGGQLTVTNSTFANNNAAGYSQGGGINNNSSSSATISNSIFWGNIANFNNTASASQIGHGSGTLTVSNTIWQGNTSGGTIYNVNPLFTNAGSGNLTLQDCSPAIDTGATNSLIIDIAGNPRPADVFAGGLSYDLGAYEMQSVSIPEADLFGGVPLLAIADGDYSQSISDSTDFGNVIVSASKTHSFTIQNNGTAALSISNITSSSPRFTISGAPGSIPASSSASFNVTFLPTATGLQYSTITINTNDCNEAVYDIGLKGNGSCINNAGSTSATACDTYTWVQNSNATYTLSGAYMHTFTNVNGCDSVHTIHLTINNSTHVSESQTACNSYTWHGSTYTTSGNYTFNYLDGNNCASVDTLHLTINLSTHNNESQTACNSYTWHGSTYTTSGNYTFNYQDGNNCASVDTLHLTINISTHNSESQTACDSYTWHGSTYTTSGNFTYNYQNGNNCPSVDTLHLTINLSTHNSASQTACDSYTWHGSTYTNSGNYTFNYLDGNNCASVDTLHLTINLSTHNSESQTACNSYTWHGLTYTNSGNYSFNYLDGNNCASVDTLHLTINISTHNSESQTACDSYTWHGSTYTNSGNYTFNYLDGNNCASVDTLHLTINLSTHNSASQTACDSYTWHGSTYTNSGNYTFNYLDGNNCASVDTLHLTINLSTHNSASQTACDSYTWHGSTYTTSGNYTFNYQDGNNCASVDTLHLTIHPSTHLSESQTACGTYSWHGSMYTVSGTYMYTYVDGNNCPSVDTLHLIISPGVSLSAKAFLAGPYIGGGLMHDSLRVKNQVPLSEPYTLAPYGKLPIGEAGGETILPSVLSVSGQDAIVDWVFLELRSVSAPSTVVANKRALIQRDGDIVSTDGVSPVFFSTVYNGMYHVTLKHRNHLGIMSANALQFEGCGVTSIDFTTSSPVYTNPLITTAPRKVFGSVYALWSGDANNNKNVKYNGLSSDKDNVLFVIGIATPNNTLSPVYRMEDLNMDGKVRYNNTDNDRVIILNNVGVNSPNTILNQHTPN